MFKEMGNARCTGIFISGAHIKPKSNGKRVNRGYIFCYNGNSVGKFSCLYRLQNLSGFLNL